VWRHLDSIATHPTSSRLQRVHVIIDFIFFDNGNGVIGPNEDKVKKALLDGLPLLRAKGILLVQADWVWKKNC